MAIDAGASRCGARAPNTPQREPRASTGAARVVAVEMNMFWPATKIQILVMTQDRRPRHSIWNWRLASHKLIW